MKKIVLIACSKKKLSQRARARDLYQGAIFKKSLEYAEKKLKADSVFILSAKYGLIKDINRVIAPYDLALNNIKKAEVRLWAKNVIAELRSVSDLGNDQFIILAGISYRVYLLDQIKNKFIPLKGMGLFEQPKELNRLLNE